MLVLAILTPGIPEYLSSSSSVLAIAVNPAWFVLQLAINVGQYTAGALLIREALLRWRKGWPTLVLLATAYAIVEEGLGDATLFNSNDGRDGVLGVYGRFVGVNWVWSTGVIAFHIVFSIGLPLLLFGLTLPEWRGRPLLEGRRVSVAIASLAATTAVEAVLVRATFGFVLSPPLLVGAGAAIAALVLLGRWAPDPPASPRPADAPPGWGRLVLGGFVAFPVTFLIEYVAPGLGAPAALCVLLDLVYYAGFVAFVRWWLGPSPSDAVRLRFAIGLLAWQSAFGLLVTVPVPYTLPLVALTAVYLARMSRAYPMTDRRDPVPPGARLG